MSEKRNRSELAQFLRVRRERLTPAQVGLPTGARRRTPGLRREEVAVLAGLSPTWYTYLEQGRDIRPSPEVLDSLAQVLRLNADEYRYLHLLGGGRSPAETPDAREKADMDFLRQVVDAIGRPDYPVYAGNIYSDVLVWNSAAASWYTDFAELPPGRRNMLWWLLTSPVARDRILDWEQDTRDAIAHFRISQATRMWDQRFTDLVAALRQASPEFREWWPDHDVSDRHARVRKIRLADGSVHLVNLATLRMSDDLHAVTLHVPVEQPAEVAVPAPLELRPRRLETPQH